MALNLPIYIPRAEAVKRYHVNVETLTRTVESGMIRAVQINGEVAVADEDITALTQRALLWAFTMGIYYGQRKTSRWCSYWD